MPLETDDHRHFRAAEGYLELGMALEANEEIERIDPDVRHVPEVLALRLQVYHQLGKWELMQVVASKLAQNDPDQVQWAVSWAFAARRADSIDAAKRILLHALERHPAEAILHFNLACYACQLGDMADAKERLAEAFTIDPDWRMMALEDEDLRPLWDSMAGELA